MYTKALILVDFEKEWTDKNSEDFVGDISQTLEKVNKLIDYCRTQEYKIIFTTHVEKDSTQSFAPNSENVKIIDNLHKKDSDTLITKYKVSPFFETSLGKELEGIREIVVCGILTNLCVRHTVEDAYDMDFEITVIKDCCVAFDEETQNFTFKDLEETREEIGFLNLDQFLN